MTTEGNAICVYLFCRAKFDKSDQRSADHYKEGDDPAQYPKMIYDELCAGKSRFGWGQERRNPAKGVLDQIRADDWIVHVNTPSDGLCAAGKVLSSLKRDGGLKVSWSPGCDFQNYFDVDVCSVVMFCRSKRVLGCKLHRALCPRRRAQMMSQQVAPTFFDFLKSEKFVPCRR